MPKRSDLLMARKSNGIKMTLREYIIPYLRALLLMLLEAASGAGMPRMLLLQDIASRR